LPADVPIIADVITTPMPQEAGAANMIAKRGAGILLKQTSDIVPVIRRMVEDTAPLLGACGATVGLAIPNATGSSSKEIAALIPAQVGEKRNSAK